MHLIEYRHKIGYWLFMPVRLQVNNALNVEYTYSIDANPIGVRTLRGPQRGIMELGCDIHPQ